MGTRRDNQTFLKSRIFEDNLIPRSQYPRELSVFQKPQQVSLPKRGMSTPFRTNVDNSQIFASSYESSQPVQPIIKSGTPQNSNKSDIFFRQDIYEPEKGLPSSRGQRHTRTNTLDQQKLQAWEIEQKVDVSSTIDNVMRKPCVPPTQLRKVDEFKLKVTPLSLKNTEPAHSRSKSNKSKSNNAEASSRARVSSEQPTAKVKQNSTPQNSTSRRKQRSLNSTELLKNRIASKSTQNLASSCNTTPKNQKTRQRKGISATPKSSTKQSFNISDAYSADFRQKSFTQDLQDYAPILRKTRIERKVDLQTDMESTADKERDTPTVKVTPPAQKTRIVRKVNRQPNNESTAPISDKKQDNATAEVAPTLRTPRKVSKVDMKPEILSTEPDSMTERDPPTANNSRSISPIEPQKPKSFVHDSPGLSFNGEYISRRNRGKFTHRYSEEQDKETLSINRVKAGFGGTPTGTPTKAGTPKIQDNKKSKWLEEQAEEAKKLLELLGGKPKKGRTPISSFQKNGPRLRKKS